MHFKHYFDLAKCQENDILWPNTTLLKTESENTSMKYIGKQVHGLVVRVFTL